MIGCTELAADSDFLVVKTGVGNLSPSRVRDHLDFVKAKLQEKLGDHVRLLVIPSREDEGIELSVLKIV